MKSGILESIMQCLKDVRLPSDARELDGLIKRIPARAEIFAVQIVTSTLGGRKGYLDVFFHEDRKCEEVPLSIEGCLVARRLDLSKLGFINVGGDYLRADMIKQFSARQYERPYVPYAESYAHYINPVSIRLGKRDVALVLNSGLYARIQEAGEEIITRAHNGREIYYVVASQTGAFADQLAARAERPNGHPNALQLTSGAIVSRLMPRI